MSSRNNLKVIYKLGDKFTLALKRGTGEEDWIGILTTRPNQPESSAKLVINGRVWITWIKSNKENSFSEERLLIQLVSR